MRTKAVALLIPTATAIICVAAPGEPRARIARVKPFVWSLVAFLIVAGPYLAVLAVTAPLFDLAALNRAWSPVKNMRPLSYYVYDPSFNWGHQWQGYSVEIGLPALVALAAVTALAVAYRARLDRRDSALLLGTTLPYLFLQTHAADWFYLHFPGAFFLGFSWRLLAMIATGTILLLCMVSRCLLVAGGSKRTVVLGVAGVVALAAACQMWLCFRGQAVAYGRYPQAEIDRRLQDLDVPTVGEYLPVGVGGLRRIPARQPLVAWTSCRSVEVHGDDPAAGRHLGRMELVIESPSACVVRLNQFFSPFLRVDGAPAHPSATPERTIDVAVPPGRQSVTVSRRGLFGVLAAALPR